MKSSGSHAKERQIHGGRGGRARERERERERETDRQAKSETARDGQNSLSPKRFGRWPSFSCASFRPTCRLHSYQGFTILGAQLKTHGTDEVVCFRNVGCRRLKAPTAICKSLRLYRDGLCCLEIRASGLGFCCLGCG